MNKNEIHELIKSTKDGEITSSKLNIFKMFESENVFVVKEFQRKYEWAKDQINELINEIEDNSKDKVFFLGMIILKKESISNEVIKLSIIDGQQRITTLFLILKCLEKNIKKFKSESLDDFDEILKKIKNTYSYVYKENGIENSRLKISDLRGQKELIDILIKNNFHNDDLKNPIYIQHFNRINDFFSNKYVKKLENFYKKIEKIQFSIVILGNKINEYKVFEDLNSKGVDLKIDDLIRNYFAQKATQHDKENVQDHIETYELLLDQVETFLKSERTTHRGFFSDQIGRWFKNYILYKLNSKRPLSDTNDKRMYNLYKEETNNKITKITDLHEEINLIKQYLKFCKWINEINNNEKYLVNQIEMYPIFFEIYKNAEKEKYNLENLPKLFALIYIPTICSKNKAKDFNKNHLEKIKMIFYKSDSFEESIKKILIEFNYTKDNVLETIEKKIAEDSIIWDEKFMNRFINYFLAKMIYEQIQVKIKVYDNSFNIEHIIPRNPNWTKLEEGEIKNKKLNLWFLNVNRLKNLALIENNLNKSLENLFYDEKVQKYKKLMKNYDFIQSTAKIFEYEKFENDEMNKRFEEMKKFSRKFATNLFNWK